MLLPAVQLGDEIPALEVYMSSMGFQGVCLSLLEGSADLAKLEPLLQALPWEMESFQLGQTFEEMGSPEQLMRISCGSTTTVRWRGKCLNVSSDDGGPGVGAAITATWNKFDEAAGPLYNLSTEAVLMPNEEPLLVATLEPVEPIYALSALEVHKSSMGFDGPVLQLSDNDEELARLESVLQSLPWELGEMKCGKTFEEMGCPDQIMQRTCGSSTTVRWRGKTLHVSSDDGGPGAGEAITAVWSKFEEAASPFYKFEGPKLIPR